MAKSKRKTTEPSRFWHEVSAIVLFGVSTLLFLALVSFHSGDLAFLKTPPNDPLENWIGPVGAYTGFILFSGIGLAAYLIPLIFIGVALILIFRPSMNIGIKVGLAILLLLTGAGLLQLMQPILGHALLNPIQSDQSSHAMLGGWLGYLINDKFLVRFLGGAGASIILGTLFVVSFIILFDIKPVDLVRQTWALLLEWYQKFEERRLENADPVERMSHERKRLEKKHRTLQKQLAKQGVLNEEDLDEDSAYFAERPMPKILDTTVAPQEADGGVEDEEEVDDAQEEEETEEKPADRKKPVVHEEENGGDEEGFSLPTFENYKLPSINLLTASDADARPTVTEDQLRTHQQLLIDTLAHFNLEVSAGDITRGATITRYEVYPAPGVRVERIVSLQRDLARTMKAEKINILAPIPGKDTVGIEVANSNKTTIALRDLFESNEWQRNTGKIPIAMGKDVYGKSIIDDLADMPHLLIAGSTGSGKSVCINSLLLSLLYRFSPDQLRLILIDPKVVELQTYNNLPHLIVPVVTDPKKVMLALRWVINEMEKRYRIMAKAGVRNIAAYNEFQAKQNEEEENAEFEDDEEDTEEIENDEYDEDEDDEEEEDSNGGFDLDMPEHLPFIVVIIDELADLMQTAPADVENAIARLSAKARAAGIHLVIATQTPRASVITGVIKTNVPARIAFQVPSGLDSRVILDENGAENLLGKGDLLYLRPSSAKLIRAQGGFVSENEVSKVVRFITRQSKPTYNTEVQEKLDQGAMGDVEISEKDEQLIRDCIEVIRQEKRASTSLLQRRLKIGYGRAAWVIDQLESRGIVGPKDGAKDREILRDLDKEDVF